MAIVGIAAVDRNGAIGKGGKLPWHYKADLRFFREQTIGHACVMGRNTWISLLKPLPNRLNIVLSRNSGFTLPPGVILLRDAESVLSLAPYLACDIFIIGGAETYLTFLSHISRWIVTEVPLAVEDADTFMTADYLNGFTLNSSQQMVDDLLVKFYSRATDGSA